MTNSATLATAPSDHYVGLEYTYIPVKDDEMMTLADAIVAGQKPGIRVLDRAFVVWGSLHENDTVISKESPQFGLFKALDTAMLRRQRLPRRYGNAAQELRELLPGVGLDTLAKMCGVSDTGYRN